MSAKEMAMAFIRSLPDDVTEGVLVNSFLSHFAADDGDEGDGLTREEWEEAWAGEIERRIADMDSGKTVGIPHEEVMRRMKEKYG